MIVFRPCRPDDARQLAELEARSVSHGWTEGQYRDSLEGEHPGLAMEEAGQLLGMAFTMIMQDEAEILNIVIDRARQGQHLGSHLLAEQLQRLRSGGIQRVFLEVRESNAVARALYRKAGFVETGLRKNYYRCDTGREHAILMELAL
jgi:ribosomal-protein-alanine N-acetyltransferase